MWPWKKTICLAFSIASTWDPLMTMIEGGREDPLVYESAREREKKIHTKSRNPDTRCDVSLTKCHEMTNGWCGEVLQNAPFYLCEPHTFPLSQAIEATAHKQRRAIGGNHATPNLNQESMGVFKWVKANCSCWGKGCFCGKWKQRKPKPDKPQRVIWGCRNLSECKFMPLLLHPRKSKECHRPAAAKVSRTSFTPSPASSSVMFSELSLN